MEDKGRRVVLGLAAITFLIEAGSTVAHFMGEMQGVGPSIAAMCFLLVLMLFVSHRPRCGTAEGSDTQCAREKPAKE